MRPQPTATDSTHNLDDYRHAFTEACASLAQHDQDDDYRRCIADYIDQILDEALPLLTR